MKRQTVEGYVNIICPKHMRKSKLAIELGITIDMLNNSIKTNKMLYDPQIKLIGIAKKVLKQEQKNG